MATTMNAVVATGLGGPEVLELRRIPLLWPRGQRDVLVRMKAAALNPADIWFRKLGGYLKSDRPLVLGHDGAGVVEAVGAGVAGIRPGDRVCFCNGGIGGETGTYAEFAVVPESQLVKIPKRVDFNHAAALPLISITLWEALFDRARLRPGEAVLIHAGAGGTGHIGIQLARIRGARVASTVSTKAKADLVKRLGAERSILYKKEDFVAAGRAWLGEGFDVALDNVGGATIQRTFAAMAPYGRIATLMGTPGDDAEATAYNANLTIHNVMMLTPMWRGLTSRLRQQAARVQRVMELLAARKLEIVVDRTFPLAKAAAAQAYLEGGKSVGKVVLEV